MNVYTLISKYKQNNPAGHYFDHETLKFFGERVSEMRVLKSISEVKDYSGNVHKAYCLSSLQHNHPCGARRKYTYFDVETFEEIMT